MKRVFVTGAAGFVGSHLVKRLAESYRVVAMARRWRDEPSFGSTVELVEGDLARSDWAQRLPDDIYTVIHLAAMTQIQRAETFPAEAFSANCLGTINLLEYAKRVNVNLVLYSSSGCVYQPQSAPLAETAKVDPVTMYGFTKYVGELAVSRYSSVFPVLILRLFHPYGPGQPEHALIPRLVANIREGRPIFIHRQRRPVLSFVYVADLVEVFLKALNLRESAILNVAGVQVASVYEICEILGSMLQMTPQYQFDDKDAENQIADTQKMQSVLCFKPQIGLEDGFSRYLGL